MDYEQLRGQLWSKSVISPRIASYGAPIVKKEVKFAFFTDVTSIWKNFEKFASELFDIIVLLGNRNVRLHVKNDKSKMCNSFFEDFVLIQ